MEEQEQMLATAEARLAEMWKLRAAFQAGNQKPPAEWMTECIAIIGMLMGKATKEGDEVDLLVTLALAMWRHGYQAAPKLEFVLPEGASG